MHKAMGLLVLTLVLVWIGQRALRGRQTAVKAPRRAARNCVRLPEEDSEF